MEAIFTKAVIRDMNFEVVLQNEKQIVSGIKNGELGGFVLRASLYNELKSRGVPIEVNTVSSVSDTGDPYINYVLLCKKAEPLPTLKDFQNRKLVICSSETYSLYRKWLDLELHSRGKQEQHDQFFSSIEYTNQPGKAIIPVFFGKSDICVVRKHLWEIYKELNPQLGTRLHVLATSPPLLEAMTCFKTDLVPEQKRRGVRNSMVNMHKSNDGRALLTIVKTKQFVPFKDEFLDSSRQLINKHAELFGRDEEIHELAGSKSAER